MTKDLDQKEGYWLWLDLKGRDQMKEPDLRIVVQEKHSRVEPERQAFHLFLRLMLRAGSFKCKFSSTFMDLKTLTEVSNPWTWFLIAWVVAESSSIWSSIWSSIFLFYVTSERVTHFHKGKQTFNLRRRKDSSPVFEGVFDSGREWNIFPSSNSLRFDGLLE